MYREIKELLKLAAVHAPLYGFLKLFCTFCQRSLYRQMRCFFSGFWTVL